MTQTDLRLLASGPSQRKSNCKQTTSRAQKGSLWNYGVYLILQNFTQKTPPSFYYYCKFCVSLCGLCRDQDSRVKCLQYVRLCEGNKPGHLHPPFFCVLSSWLLLTNFFLVQFKIYSFIHVWIGGKWIIYIQISRFKLSSNHSKSHFTVVAGAGKLYDLKLDKVNLFNFHNYTMSLWWDRENWVWRHHSRSC